MFQVFDFKIDDKDMSALEKIKGQGRIYNTSLWV